MYPPRICASELVGLIGVEVFSDWAYGLSTYEMNSKTLLWFVAMIGISATSVALGYLVDVTAAAALWLIATLVLLASRPD
jgi:hypothetical protein